MTLTKGEEEGRSLAHSLAGFEPMSIVHGVRQQLTVACLAAGRRAFSSCPVRCSPVLLSTQFIPSLRSEELGEEQLESVKLLLRGGYIRQSSSGFFSLLPLGLRIVRKIEGIIDEEMERVIIPPESLKREKRKD